MRRTAGAGKEVDRPVESVSGNQRSNSVMEDLVAQLAALDSASSKQP